MEKRGEVEMKVVYDTKTCKDVLVFRMKGG
jgi:hypothetical protein